MLNTTGTHLTVEKTVLRDHGGRLRGRRADRRASIGEVEEELRVLAYGLVLRLVCSWTSAGSG